MILNYRSIGELLIETEGISDKSSLEYKRFILGCFCSELVEYQKTDKDGGVSIGNILQLNLDTACSTAEFSLAEQLDPYRASQIMLFKKPAPNDPNIFGTTNALISIVAFQLWHSLDDATMKQVKWTRPGKAAEFKMFMEQIRDCFFVKTRTGWLLNKDLLVERQREQFPTPEEDERYQTQGTNAKYNDLLKSDIGSYHKQTLKELYDQNQGFALAIDGKYLHQGEYAREYLDFMYHKTVEGRYAKKIGGVCHLCHSEGSLGEEVSLKQKFYGTTNPHYFDNISNTKTYTSFGICQDCDNKLVVGMTHAMNNMRFKVLDLSCIIIPEIDHVSGMVDQAELRAVERVLDQRAGRKDMIDREINTLLNLGKRCRGFNMLFYDKQPLKQEFKIINLVKELRFADLAEKTRDLEDLCESNQLYMINDNLGLSLRGLRMLILPSRRSHKLKSEGEYSVVARKIAKLADDYLNSRPLRYNEIIRSFVDVWSRINNDSQETYLDHELAALTLGMYLKHLQNFNMLKGVKAMDSEQKTSTSLDPVHHQKYLEYFATHAYLYSSAENSRFYRGLFILGTMIGKIENAEFKKSQKKTFSNRLNFKGISPRRIKDIYNTVEEYLKIREVWTDNQALAYCNESLLGIESSSVLPQEVVYYLLAGRAFENYLAIIYNKTNQEDQSKEEQND